MSFHAGHLAQVHDLGAARERRAARDAVPAAVDPMPSDVWAEVEAANRLFEELAADGRRIVFDDGHLDGRLVIALCDLEGRVLRSVGPGELLGTSPQGGVAHGGGAA